MAEPVATWEGLLAETDLTVALQALDWTEEALVALTQVLAPIAAPANVAEAIAALMNLNIPLCSRPEMMARVILPSGEQATAARSSLVGGTRGAGGRRRPRAPNSSIKAQLCPALPGRPVTSL